MTSTHLENVHPAAEICAAGAECTVNFEHWTVQITMCTEIQPFQASLKRKSVSGGAAGCLKKGRLGTFFFTFANIFFSPKMDNIFLTPPPKKN